VVVHYVRYPSYQKPIPKPSLYPICGHGTWETVQGWLKAPPGSTITCFGCILKFHNYLTYPEDYMLMLYEPPEAPVA
jgi:hypothetical protein